MGEIEMIRCSRCGNLMPKIRLEKYGYSYCIDCSVEKPKVALDVVHGEGDHVWNDIIILDYDTATEIAQKEARLLKKTHHSDIPEPEPDEKLKSLIVKDTISEILKEDLSLDDDDLIDLELEELEIEDDEDLDDQDLDE